MMKTPKTLKCCLLDIQKTDINLCPLEPDTYSVIIIYTIFNGKIARLQKEKDLELTARIGKELLAANGRLESRVTSLEGELRSARDNITQLRHDLSAKTDLLQVTFSRIQVVYSAINIFILCKGLRNLIPFCLFARSEFLQSQNTNLHCLKILLTNRLLHKRRPKDWRQSI